MASQNQDSRIERFIAAGYRPRWVDEHRDKQGHTALAFGAPVVVGASGAPHAGTHLRVCTVGQGRLSRGQAHRQARTRQEATTTEPQSIMKIYASPFDSHYHAVPYSETVDPCPAMTRTLELYFVEDSSVDHDHAQHFLQQGVAPALWLNPCRVCVTFDV